MDELTRLRCGSTNCFAVRGDGGFLLFDTGWAGSLPLLRAALKQAGIPQQALTHLLVSHYHPDHMGIAQQLAETGVQLIAADTQAAFLHAADPIFAKEKNPSFRPIDDAAALILPCAKSRAFLRALGIAGEFLPTPGHTDDSVSLLLDSGDALVGDLCPLFTVEAYHSAALERSWAELLRRGARRVHYAHAGMQTLEGIRSPGDLPAAQQE